MRALVLSLVLFVTAACAQAPVTLETAREKLAAAELTYQGVLLEVKSLVTTGLIKPGSDTAEAVGLSIIEVRAALDQWQLSPDSPNYLAIATAALLRLQQHLLEASLQESGIKPGTLDSNGPFDWRMAA